ncbi:threonine/serine dehydratase [Tropicibacter sp. R15_0]|uniref:threonine ammonia-lyase n=1 Tax=Tropicibacter sp. R15_0 TaxID=2821101 RepID=UPI001ADAE7DF|nr:threonine/serine dehydratase [Tropicibacter sp. R15_0]MBO9466356.1 threonine/serine dehydratase [Tropicibacter sp. R15_0]
MNFDMISAASDRLKGHVRRTPLLSSPALDEIAGKRILIKAECLQHTGSFKFRGGWSAVSALDPETRSRGVIAFSSGNHAQGIAAAAQAFGVPAVIVMPADAPSLKIEGTKRLGGEVVLYDRAARECRETIGTRLAEERGLTLIKPYDEPQVIAGQGTCGLEIAEQAAELGVTSADVLVCCGGGGLTSGIALALEQLAPDMCVHPAEPEGYDDVARSLRSGQKERNTTEAGGLCDAILTPTPGDITFPIMSRLCGAGVVTSEDEALRAMGLAFQHLKVVAEPGGAVALACALFHADDLEHDTVIATISGGNVDPAIFARALKTL